MWHAFQREFPASVSWALTSFKMQHISVYCGSCYCDWRWLRTTLADLAIDISSHYDLCCWWWEKEHLTKIAFIFKKVKLQVGVHVSLTVVIRRKKHWSGRHRRKLRRRRRNVWRDFSERSKRGSRERRFVIVCSCYSMMMMMMMMMMMIMMMMIMMVVVVKLLMVILLRSFVHRSRAFVLFVIMPWPTVGVGGFVYSGRLSVLTLSVR